MILEVFQDLIADCASVLVEKELGGEIKFIYYGEIDSIQPPSKDTYPRYISHLRNYVKFYPARMKNNELRKKMSGLPTYRWYDTIRPIGKEIYEDIIRICSVEN
jgi:hypothetical protein